MCFLSYIGPFDFGFEIYIGPFDFDFEIKETDLCLLVISTLKLLSSALINQYGAALS